MKPKILVVDDEEGIRFTFKEFLSGEGYEVMTAENFHTAMAIISDTELDLIFADIILGEHRGIEILRCVKDKEMHCPVIIITGQPDVDTASDSVRLGAFDYLIKPVREAALLRAAKMALENKALMDEKTQYRNNLEAIFRSVTDAIITVDKNMRIIESNAAVRDVFGKEHSKLVGGHFSQTLGVSHDAFEKILGKVLENETTLKEYPIECKYSDRPRQILSASCSPLLDSNRKSMGAVLVVKDITRLVDMESELKKRHGFHNIIGKTRKMRDIFRLIEMLAGIDSTVLITGESGTGKELIAKALHYTGTRSDHPMISVNCSALSENVLESELFGHVKGAFTGAVVAKVGCLQAADRGTIFLDEIGEMSPSLQVKILRALQEKEFFRVGSSVPVRVDVRVIAATNRNLKEEMRRGNFREDLYYRIKVVEIEMPPLRDRLEDIPILIKHFCELYNKSFKKNIEGVTDDVLDRFMCYPWPGNVRELKHAIEHSFIHCKDKTITMDHTPVEIRKHSESPKLSIRIEKSDESGEIMRLLRETDWNKAKTARRLGISRKTLYEKIKKYDIQTPE